MAQDSSKNWENGFLEQSSIPLKYYVVRVWNNEYEGEGHEILAGFRQFRDARKYVELNARQARALGFEHVSERGNDEFFTAKAWNGSYPGTTWSLWAIISGEELGNCIADRGEIRRIRERRPVIDPSCSLPVGSAEKIRLKERLDFIYEAIADQNIAYGVSMNGTCLPDVVGLSLGENDIDLDSLRFLAGNGLFFPESMKDATLEDFSKHLSENERQILSEVEKTAESDFHYR